MVAKEASSVKLKLATSISYPTTASGINVLLKEKEAPKEISQICYRHSKKMPCLNRGKVNRIFMSFTMAHKPIKAQEFQYIMGSF